VVRNSVQAEDADGWQYRAQVTQTLFRWDQWQQLRRADAEVALAEANYRASEQDLVVRVSQAYFDVLAAEDTLDRRRRDAAGGQPSARAGGEALRSRA
jgi:outer membrane protein TolC